MRIVLFLLLLDNALGTKVRIGKTSSHSMAQLRVHFGHHAHRGLEEDQALFFVGKHEHLKNLTFQHIQESLSGYVEEVLWNNVIKKLPETGSVSVYMNQILVVSVSGKTSRYNAPSNCLAVLEELKNAPYDRKATRHRIILVANYADIIPSVAAISRLYPLYYRKTTEAGLSAVDIDIIVADEKHLQEKDVEYLGNLINSIRTAGGLIDNPANELTTDVMLGEAIAVAEKLGVKSTVIQGDKLREQGFGGIYSVGKAGPTDPVFVVLSYTPENAKQTYALVGKGVVFDTGGMQIKGSDNMPKMKRDMAGAADVLMIFNTLVQAGFRENLYACLCIVENNISPLANKPDDIITMLSGKTVEITDTDCEGRLILADGVYYARNVLNADTIFDLATLSDNSVISGKYHGAVMTNNAFWESKIFNAGLTSGDLLVPMIFAPELHFQDLKSEIADMVNYKGPDRKGPFSPVGGLFIGSHIDYAEPNGSWIHLDIAYPELNGQRGYGFGPALFSLLFGELTDVPILKDLGLH